MITAAHQGQATLSLSPLCHQQIVFITVKGFRFSVLACQGFPACLLCCVHPSIAHCSPDHSLRHRDTDTHTLLLTDLRPCQLRTNLEIRNREKKRREWEKKRDACWTGFEKAFFLKMSFLLHLSELMHGNIGFVYVALYGVNQSISQSVFSLPSSQNKQRCCITQQNVSRTNA